MAGAFMVASCLSQGARGPSHPSGTRAHRLLRAARHRSGFAEASAHRDGPDDGRKEPADEGSQNERKHQPEQDACDAATDCLPPTQRHLRLSLQREKHAREDDVARHCAKRKEKVQPAQQHEPELRSDWSVPQPR